MNTSHFLFSKVLFLNIHREEGDCASASSCPGQADQTQTLFSLPPEQHKAADQRVKEEPLPIKREEWRRGTEASQREDHACAGFEAV